MKNRERGPGPRVRLGRAPRAEGHPGLAPAGRLKTHESPEAMRSWGGGRSRWIRNPPSRPWAPGPLTSSWQCSPRCLNWAGQPPRSGSPHHSSATHWAVCCLPHPRTHRGGGQRPPWCARSVAAGVVVIPGAGAQWGCESTFGHMTGNQCHMGLLLPCDLHLGSEDRPPHRMPGLGTALWPLEDQPRLREGLECLCPMSLAPFHSGTSSAHFFVWGNKRVGRRLSQRLPGGWSGAGL